MSNPNHVRWGVPGEVVAQLNELFERGLYLQAFELSKAYGPLQTWQGAGARVIAARLAHHLGSASLCARITARAAKEHPDDASAQYYHAYTILEWRGPLPAWNRLRELGDMPKATPEQLADLCALRGQIASSLRDFQTAESLVLRAQELHPGDPWLEVIRSHLMENQDRYEESLAAAENAVRLHPYPYYRAGILAQAQALQLLNRDREALELLRQASSHLESAAVETLLFALQVELGQPEEALLTLDRYERLTPLRQKDTDQWLRSQRCRLMHLCGRREEALQLSQTLDDKFHKAITSRMTDSGHQPKRVQLPVGFVRQNYKTCAPATLAALGRYWQCPTDHLQLVTEMCYDGTPPQRQREWAEKNGWCVKEFRLTWESGVALLDAGIPFAISTVETANAHLQAIVGYDTTRGTFSLRDPYNPYLREVEAETFLDYYKSSGPRCFAMVPLAEAAKLQAITLPEADLYDLIYQHEQALANYDRTRAVEVLSQLESLDAKHRLTWNARRSLAYHDVDAKENERCVDALRELYPKDGNLLLSKISFLRSGPRDELLAFQTRLCKDKEADPLFFQQLASELLVDAREEAEAERLLKKCLRGRPYDATALHVLADLRWQQRQLETAYELYRFAASLEDKREEPTRALFAASRHLRKHHEVIGYLRDRFARFGRYSHLSLVTLFWSEVDLTEIAQAFKHLAQALEWRPDDAGLRCFAADIFARFGNYSEARKHLDHARGKTRQLEWLRTAAQVATMEDKRTEALGLWHEVLKLDPMARDAHEAVLQLIAETEGPQAVSQRLENLETQFPHNLDFQQMVVSWWRRENVPRAITVLEKMVTLHPVNSWVRRELADLLAETDQIERALQEVAVGMQLEPNVPFGYCVRGFIYRKQQRIPEAAEDFKQALRFSVDNDYAQRALLEVCAEHAEKKAALEFIQQELLRQVVFGTGLLVFRELAYPILEPRELADFLRKALQERPDLWHSWSALMQQLGSQGELHEAEEVARGATKRFPLSPRMWLDYALIMRLQESSAGEIECLETAVRLNPAWTTAAKELAEAYERAGDFWKARRVMEAVLVQQPLDASIHELLAHFLWKTGDRDEALQRLQKALEIDPGLMWAWDQLPVWGKDRGHPDLATEKLRKLVESRAGEVRSWLLLAQQLEGRETLNERLEAVEKALQLQPRSVWAHTVKVNLLMEADRKEEAVKACKPPVFGDKPPRELLRLEARAERASGNEKRSMTLLDALVENHPDYTEAWHLKASWHWEAGEMEKAAQAADKITRLNPLEPIAWGYKGAWEWERGNKAAAIVCFRKGYEISHNYTYAGFSLFDLLIEQGQAAEAAEVLHLLRKHTPGPNVLCRDIKLAIAREERHRAPDLLVKVLQSEEADAEHVGEAWEVMKRAGLADKAAEVIQACVFNGVANPAAASLWMKIKLQKKKWSNLYLIQNRGLRQPLKEAVLEAWLDVLNEEIKASMDDYWKCQWLNLRLKKCLKHFGQDLQNSQALWAQVTVALINLKRHRASAQWVAGWQQRKDLELWMLHNISIIWERAGDDAQAGEAYQAAVKIAGHEPMAARLYCRAAIEKALAGDATEAGQLIARAKSSDLDEHQMIYWRLANLVFRAASMPGHKLADAEKADLEELFVRKKDRPQDYRLLKRIVKALTSHAGNRRLGWWLWWKSYGDVVITVTLIIIVLTVLLRS